MIIEKRKMEREREREREREMTPTLTVSKAIEQSRAVGAAKKNS